MTIQIVTWNSAIHLPSTLGALKHLPSHIGVVRIIDNGSTDDSVSLARTLLPQADIITLQKNIGFAQGHNVGFAKCTTEFVATVDPDVTVAVESLEELLSVFEDETVGAVQGKLYRQIANEDDRPIIDSAGIIQTITLNGKERGAGEVDHGQYNAPEDLLAVTGAFGIYRLSALQQVSHSDIEVFDVDFFAYKEDVDLGWRLKRAGFVSRYEPVTAGTHARTLGKRGSVAWFLNPAEAPRRLFSPRTKYSIRNYVWMLIKNISWQQELIHGIPIAARLLFILPFTIIFFPLFVVWFEIVEKIPVMIHKRHG